MYELISVYQSLTDKQRQELKLDDEDPIIAQEKLDLMKQQVEEANKRMLEEERRYEGKLRTKIRIYHRLEIIFETLSLILLYFRLSILPN